MLLHGFENKCSRLVSTRMMPSIYLKKNGKGFSQMKENEDLSVPLVNIPILGLILMAYVAISSL